MARHDAEERENPALPADFGSRVAHEIRSPLNLVAGALAELQSADGEAKDRLMELAGRGVAKLGRFADRLSLLSRIESGSLEIGRAPAELRGIVDGATRRARQIMSRRRVEVTIGGEASVRIEGDASLLEMAVQELVENALRHARHAVQINVQHHESTARVQIVDDGRGVSPGDARAIFVRHGNDSPRGGLHVGLAIARTLARAHGGDVELDESAPGERTVFVLTLPCDGRPEP